MATSLTSSFAGNKATDFYLSALIEGKTLATKGITIDTSTDFKYIVRGFDMSNFIATGTTCSWADAGTVTITEGVKEVQPFRINLTQCFKDFKGSWTESPTENLPSDVESAIAKKTADAIRAKTETDLWRSSVAAATVNGNAYTVNLFDGYTKMLNGVATEITGVTLTSSNIVAQLGRLYDALPDAIKSLDNSQKVIFVSFKAEGAYRQAQIAMGNNTSVGDKPLDYLGIEVRGVGIYDNVMVAGLRESFHVASNIGLESASVNIKSMYSTTLERNARIEAEWKYVPAVSNASQIVLYNF